MKLSLVIPCLNSHEILRRQFLHFEKIGIPEDTEIIIVDDGSEPPLKYEGTLPLKIIYTNDKRSWTWALARNRGVKEAKGDYILMTDIDHILPRSSIDACTNFNGDKVYFMRQFGILDENGNLSQDLDVLRSYGLLEEYIKNGLKIGALPNNICLKKSVFYEIGGYREDLIGRRYPQGEDRSFKKAWRDWTNTLKKESQTLGVDIYMFPNGKYCGDKDYNPFGLFHTLSRK